MKSKLFDEFLIGSWVTYFSYDIISHEEQMKRLTELGVNYHPFPFSWYKPETHDDLEDWKEIDRLCQKYNVLYGMESAGDKKGTTEEAFANNIAFAKEMSDNLVVYHIFDEPMGSEVQMLGNWVRRYRAADQRVWPTFNLNPSSVSVRRLGATYEEHLQAVIDAAGVENMAFLSHDFYPLLKDGSVKEYIFADMENIRKAAYENGKLRTHAFLQAFEGGVCRMPRIEEIRWQAYCYLAYGFKALSYFNIVSPRHDTHGGFSNAPIMLDGEVRDPVLLENIGKLNWELRAVGNEMLSMQTVHAYHTHEISTYYAKGIVELLIESYRVQPLDKERKFIVTEHETNDRFMLVNNDFEWEGEAKFAVLGANAVSVFDPATKEYKKCDYKDGILTVAFKKGEGLLFKIF